MAPSSATGSPDTRSPSSTFDRVLEMSLDVTASLRIDSPPSAVAAVQFDPTRDPDWIGGVDRVELLTPPPLALQSQVRRLGRFLGRRIEWVMRIDELEADRHVGMHALRSPFPMDVDYLLEPLDGGQATQGDHQDSGQRHGHVRSARPVPRPDGPAIRDR